MTLNKTIELNEIYLIVLAVVYIRKGIEEEQNNLIPNALINKISEGNPKYSYGRALVNIYNRKERVSELVEELFLNNEIPVKEVFNLENKYLIKPISEMANFFYTSSSKGENIDFLCKEILDLMITKGHKPVIGGKQPYPFWRYYNEIFIQNVILEKEL